MRNEDKKNTGGKIGTHGHPGRAADDDVGREDKKNTGGKIGTHGHPGRAADAAKRRKQEQEEERERRLQREKS